LGLTRIRRENGENEVYIDIGVIKEIEAMTKNFKQTQILCND